MNVLPVQHGKIAVLHCGFAPERGFDSVGDEGGISALVVHDGMDRGSFGQVLLALLARAGERLAWPAAVFQFDAADLGIAADGMVGAAQNRRCGAPVFRHGHALHAAGAESFQELVEGAAGGAAKAIDCLVGVADGEDVGVLSSEQFRELDLRDVGVLELVDQDEARAFLRGLQNGLPSAQHLDRASDDVPEGTEALLLQQIFDVAEGACDLMAAAQHFLARHGFGVFRLGDALQRNFVALDLRKVRIVILRRAQLVMAAAEEIHQVAQKFARVGGLDEAIKPHLANAAAQQNEQVLVIEQSKLDSGVAQKRKAIGVKRVGLQTGLEQPGGSALRPQVRVKNAGSASNQFGGAITGVGDGENFVRLCLSGVDEMRDASREDGSLAGTSARDHQHGAMYMLDGLPLARRWRESVMSVTAHGSRITKKKRRYHYAPMAPVRQAQSPDSAWGTPVC